MELFESKALLQREGMCADLGGSRPIAQTLLYIPRLPRAGNDITCKVLSACSSKQVRTACGTAIADEDAANFRAKACPSSSSSFSFYGSEKLDPSKFACSAGINGTSPDCASFNGDIAATCKYLGTAKLPGAVMVATARFPDLAMHPCPIVRPAVRMLAILRDPGERAQSAYNFMLRECVCNFKYQWCKQFTSFRYSNRQGRLCDGRTPRHGFGAALGVLRTHGNAPWPITSSEEHHVLGRFASGMVKEVYGPWFGSYQAGEDGPWRVSTAVAKATLSKCFTWVGIVEELPLSLLLLKAEMPGFFGNIDVTAFDWVPAAGASKPGGDPSSSNESAHPYLRTHLLTRDYEIYDTEKGRLLHRAKRAGLPVVSTNLRGGSQTVF